MVESLDASVVMDDTCVRQQGLFQRVPVTGDPIEGGWHTTT
jgi:hypothetical protein